MHMPPPIHGAAVMGKYIHDSKLINERFECIYLNPSASQKVENVGRHLLRKIPAMLSKLNTIRKILKKERPDLCYFTATIGKIVYLNALIVLLLKSNKRPIVLHLHNKGTKRQKPNYLNRMAYRIMFSDVKVILLANELYDDVREYVKPENVYICPNGIPETLETPTRRTSAHQPYTFLFLSNMIESKGVYTLLKACAILKKKKIPFRCNFIGQWSDICENAFLQKTKELSLTGEVTALGAKFGKEKREYFKTADAFVFPTYFKGETFGLVLLEAMEYALPCISTYEGGIPSVIENERTGLLTQAQDPMALAEKMEWLIANPAKGIEMGRRGRERFQKYYTLPVFEARLADILDACSKTQSK